MVGEKPVLTIAIPTYNRNEKLKRSVEVLVPQLNSKVKLLILDNESTVPVAETLVGILSELNNKSAITIVRNKSNVGMAANIIRCFETCDTEWMWLLGDDDPPSIDAVSGILDDISSNNNSAFINYKSHMTNGRTKDFYSLGIEDFIRKIDDFGNLLFISLGVYNLQMLKGDLRLSYQLAYSVAPHLVYLLSSIKENTEVAFLTRRIHDFTLYDTDSAENWSWVSLSLSISVIYEIPLEISKEARRIFADHILTHVKPSRIVYSMLESSKYTNVPLERKQYLLRQTFFRSLLYKGIGLNILPYIWYNAKLMLANIFTQKGVVVIQDKDDRI